MNLIDCKVIQLPPKHMWEHVDAGGLQDTRSTSNGLVPLILITNKEAALPGQFIYDKVFQVVGRVEAILEDGTFLVMVDGAVVPIPSHRTAKVVASNIRNISTHKIPQHCVAEYVESKGAKRFVHIVKGVTFNSFVVLGKPVSLDTLEL